VIISDAVAADAGEILTLQRAAFLTDAQIYDDPFMASLTQTLDEIEALIGRADVVFVVARIGHRIVGSVRAEVHGDRATIGRLMTAPDMQGRGIGSRLMDQVEARLEPIVGILRLHTGNRSEANIAFYQRRGYVLVDDPDVPPDAVTMTKPA
jgi:ribosomal protein S18 acetylase RimI-like enzyme